MLPGARPGGLHLGVAHRLREIRPAPAWAFAGFAAAGVATVSGLGYLGFLVGPPAIGFLSELTSLRVGLFLLVLLSVTAAALVSLVVRTTGGKSNPFADTAG